MTAICTLHSAERAAIMFPFICEGNNRRGDLVLITRRFRTFRLSASEGMSTIPAAQGEIEGAIKSASKSRCK
jgi:hypothetical protein